MASFGTITGSPPSSGGGGVLPFETRRRRGKLSAMRKKRRRNKRWLSVYKFVTSGDWKFIAMSVEIGCQSIRDNPRILSLYRYYIDYCSRTILSCSTVIRFLLFSRNISDHFVITKLLFKTFRINCCDRFRILVQNVFGI